MPASDANGRYLTPQLELPAINQPSTITLGFLADGYWPSHTIGVPIRADTTSSQDFTLLPICQDATVRGTVVNAATQQPIANALVTGEASSALTDAAGHYTLEHLRVGVDNSPIQVAIAASADGYYPLTKKVTVFCNANLTIDFGRPTPQGHIVVVKRTDPAGASQAFAFDRTWTPDALALSDGQASDSGPLTPGSGYSVSEEAAAGWDQTSATCSDGSPVTNIDLAPGETVTCTFRNRQRGRIVVTEATQPSPDPTATSFSFAAGGGLDPASFALGDGQSHAFDNVVPQAGYSVAQTVPAGWSLTGATCSDGSPVTSIDVAPGETVTCAFTDSRAEATGTIVVRKRTNPSPDGTGASFSFTSGGGLSPSSFALQDGGTQTFSGVAAKAGYSVAEQASPGWDLASASCDDGSPVTNIDLAPGETVTCTFTNVERGHIVIRKQTRPAGVSQLFAFTADYAPSGFLLADGGSNDSGPLRPGSYGVAETPAPGWDGSAWCDDGDSPAAIILRPGATVTCTFTNTERGAVVVRKQTNPSPDGSNTTFAFTAGGGLSPTIFGLQGGGSETFANVVPRSGYTLAETATPGWDPTGASCSDGSPLTNIDVSPGETVTCTFTNTQRGTISIVKTVSGGPPGSSQSFAFQLRQGASTSSDGTTLATATASATNGGSVSFAGDYAPGTYQLCELVMPGWRTSLTGTFVPNSLNNPLVDNSAVCTSFSLGAGDRHVFTVDNTPPPGGLARTIGFWKNWSSCSGSSGKQRPVLDQTLAAAGSIAIGALIVRDCKTAVAILNKSDIKTGAKQASDPAFNLAAQLLAAKLNVVAGAATCSSESGAVTNAQALLALVQFTGTGTYAKSMTGAQRNQANNLATTLDRYNNNLLC
jgi:hypothetical protein